MSASNCSTRNILDIVSASSIAEKNYRISLRGPMLTGYRRRLLNAPENERKPLKADTVRGAVIARHGLYQIVEIRNPYGRRELRYLRRGGAKP